MANTNSYTLYQSRRAEVIPYDNEDKCGRNLPDLADNLRCVSLCFTKDWENRELNKGDRCNLRKVTNKHCERHNYAYEVLSRMQHRYDYVEGIDLAPYAKPVSQVIKRKFIERYGRRPAISSPFQLFEMVDGVRNLPETMEELSRIPELEEPEPAKRIAKFLISKYVADVRVKIAKQCFFGDVDLRHVIAAETAGYYYTINRRRYDMQKDFQVDHYSEAFEILKAHSRTISYILKFPTHIKYFVGYRRLTDPAHKLLAKCMYRELKKLNEEHNRLDLLRRYGNVRDDTFPPVPEVMKDARTFDDLLTATRESVLFDRREESPGPTPQGTPIGSYEPYSIYKDTYGMDVTPYGTFLPDIRFPESNEAYLESSRYPGATIGPNGEYPYYADYPERPDTPDLMDLE